MENNTYLMFIAINTLTVPRHNKELASPIIIFQLENEAPTTKIIQSESQ